MRHIRQWVAALAFLWLCGCAAPPPPDLTGAWKLNPSRSRFEAGASIPAVWVDAIEHHEPEIKLQCRRESPAGSFRATYTTDGSEACNVVDGYMVCSRARWDGPMLRIDSTVKLEKGDATWQERWSLGRDGKTLTIDRRGASPRFLFLERQ